MTGEVAGFTPEHEVQGSKRSRIRCIIICVTLISLVGLAVVVAILVEYASDSPALLVYPSDFVILEGSVGEKSAKQHYKDIMNSFATSYNQDTQSEHLDMCSFQNPRTAGTECFFNLDWVSRKNDGWGYDSGRPCFLLAFNAPKDWVPDPYKSPAELPPEMPYSLKLHIEDSFYNSEPTEFLWVSCSGETPSDTELMGSVSFAPWRGFPLYYFPVRYDSDPQAIPVLALNMDKPHRGALIGIRCHFWAKNLKPPYIAARIELLL